MYLAVDQHLHAIRQRENYFFARTGGKLKNASQMSVRVHKQPQFFLFSTKIDMITNLQFTFLQRDTEFLQCSNWEDKKMTIQQKFK